MQCISININIIELAVQFGWRGYTLWWRYFCSCWAWCSRTCNEQYSKLVLFLSFVLFSRRNIFRWWIGVHERGCLWLGTHEYRISKFNWHIEQSNGMECMHQVCSSFKQYVTCRHGIFSCYSSENHNYIRDIHNTRTTSNSMRRIWMDLYFPNLFFDHSQNSQQIHGFLNRIQQIDGNWTKSRIVFFPTLLNWWQLLMVSSFIFCIISLISTFIRMKFK